MGVLARGKTKLADLVMPWAAGNASVWPSQHAMHGNMLEEIAELHQQLEGAVEERDRMREALDWICAEPEDPIKVQMWALAGLGREPTGGR